MTMQSKQKPSRLCYRAVEFRAADTVGDGRTLEGYAAVFNVPTIIESYFYQPFREEIASGAFKKTLRERTPVLQFDHGHDARTGTVPIGSMQELREDDTGLFVSARLFDNQVVEPIRQAIEGGAIDGMSFRFRVLQEQWTDVNGKVVKDDELVDTLWDESSDRHPLTRTIKEVELFELGPVVFPAYDATSVGVRSMLATLDESGRAELVAELVAALNQSRSSAKVDERAPEVEEAGPVEPSDDGHSARNVEPTRSGHSVYLGETNNWYLPTPGNNF